MKMIQKHTRIILSIMAILAIGIAAVYAATGEQTRIIGNRTWSSIATGSAAIDYELTPPKTALIKEVRITLDTHANTAELLVIGLDSGSGSAYDCAYTSSTTAILTDVSHYWATYDPPLTVKLGDTFTVNWPNTTTAIYGLEVIYDLR